MIEVDSKEVDIVSGEIGAKSISFGKSSGDETVEESLVEVSSEDSKEEASPVQYRNFHVKGGALTSIVGDESDEITKTAPNFYCQICFETNDESVAFQLPCSHQFCKECLVSYVNSKVTDGKVYPVCFFIDEEAEDTASTPRAHQKHNSCGAVIPEYVIENLLRENTTMLEKYRRYKFAKENTNARECPFCAVWNIKSPEELAEPNGGKIICMNSECQKMYCFYHANAHDFDIYPTCAEYDAAMAPQMKANEDYINTCSKPCPGCHIYVSKTGGCNHMKCQCGVCFCWLCGKQIDDSIFPAHFQWWNPSGCSNLQMNEAIEPSTGSRICAALLSCLQIIVLGPLTLVSTLTSSLLCCSCIVMKLQMQRPLTTAYVRTFFSTCITSWGAFWMFVFFIPVVIAGGSVAAAVVLVLVLVSYPCYAAHRLQQGEYPWPDWVTINIRRVAVCFNRCCGCGYPINAYGNAGASSSAPANTNQDTNNNESGLVSTSTTDHFEQLATELPLYDVEQGRPSKECEGFSFDENRPVSGSAKDGYSSIVTKEPLIPDQPSNKATNADTSQYGNIVDGAVVLGDIDIESPRAV